MGKKEKRTESILADYWQMITHDKDSDLLYSHSLEMLEKMLGKIEAVIFSWDKKENTLIAQKVIRNGILQDGEEKIIVKEDAPLFPLVRGIKDMIYERNKSSICVALRYNNEFLGMLRIVKLSGKKFSPINLNQISKFCSELTVAINNLRIYLQNEKHVRQLKALFEISSNIVRSIHLKELLRLIVKSIVTNMGFDRVRLYIIDGSKKGESEILKGEVSYDIRGEMKSLENEKYELKEKVHPLVDIVLGNEKPSIYKRFRNIIVFIPLQIKDRVVGLMVVDNILSQQKITEEDVCTIKSFAGQVAMAIENARLFEKVEELSITDSLTGLYVIRHFKERLKIEFYRTQRYNTSFALFLIDVDDFKEINDKFGHPVGDEVLKNISSKIKRILRKTDFACRYGGDEFIACLIDVNKKIAGKLAQRLVDSIKGIKVNINGKKTLVNVSISIGVSLVPLHSKDMNEAVSFADKALYEAKRKGKNKFCIWEKSFL